MENKKTVLFLGERSKLSTIARQLKISRSSIECVNYDSQNFDLKKLAEEQKGKSFARVVVDGLIKQRNPSIGGDARVAFNLPVAYA